MKVTGENEELGVRSEEIYIMIFRGGISNSVLA